MNLLNSDDAAIYYNKNISFLSNINLVEFIDTFKIFFELQVSVEILNFDEKGFITLQEHGLERRVSGIDVFNCAKKLIALKLCKGFARLSIGFNNQPQFCNAMFEIDCAYFISTHEEVVSIEFSPKVTVRNETKEPDFKFLTKSGVWFFCECKSVASVSRIKGSRIVRLMNLFKDQLLKMADNKFRVEIAFNILPAHWNRNYIDQLISVINVLIEKESQELITINIDNKHETYVKLVAPADKPFFSCAINLGNKPLSENPTLIIGEHPNLQKDIKRSIKDAITQLSEEDASLIFIYSLNKEHSRKAISNFFYNNIASSLCGIFYWLDDPFYYRNTKGLINILEHLNLKNIGS